ncbi:hypothetical protein PISMIDRAFT_677023 [Pisolithus microcarpus 441]|uniref:Uncharacterized protein n=1 Tax=Pisolithus microcarpus 441 TaxID=765257 RepID=A0A0C9Z8R5_9AGAM|nr:hypothetical protein PISMIDRAFT_677023 [Pisolithus microcarpus 441]
MEIVSILVPSFECALNHFFRFQGFRDLSRWFLRRHALARKKNPPLPQASPTSVRAERAVSLEP